MNPPNAIGRVFDIQRFSVHDGPGIRTTVFLSGCSLRCAWCHNPEAFFPSLARTMTASEIMQEVLKDSDYYAHTGGGLTLSGGEPLLQPDLVRAVLLRAEQSGIHRCVQTAGLVPAATFRDLVDLVDLFQFDLKHVDSRTHRALTGVPNERILANARMLIETGAQVELRMPLVPRVNDAPEYLDQLAERIRQLGARALRIVPYQRMYVGKYERLGLKARFSKTPAPSLEHLGAVADRLSQHGITTTIDG